MLNKAEPRFYDFAERYLWSSGFLDEGIERILVDRIPGCVGVTRADEQADRSGTDYWAMRQGLPPLSVDVKVRDEDFAPRGHDDLALETWSVVDQKPGWTRDQSKRTDFVLWFWRDTRRFFLVAFPPLCRVFGKYWRDWAGKYKVARQASDGWQSECVFVPRATLIDRLNAWQWGWSNGNKDN